MNIADLLKEAEELPKIVDGTGALMAFGPGSGLPSSGLLAAAAWEIATIRGTPPLHLMVNVLPPGCVVPKHRDWLPPTRWQKVPTVERWHLPLATNQGCKWWDEVSGDRLMPLGVWHGPMPYWKFHQVSNLGSTPRVHLVVDLDSREPQGAYDP